MTRPWTPPKLVPEPREVTLTPQQANVLSGICCGHESKQIAARLFMAEDTVKTHLRRVFDKLGARNRTHAAALVCSEQVVVHVVTKGKDAT